VEVLLYDRVLQEFLKSHYRDSGSVAVKTIVIKRLASLAVFYRHRLPLPPVALATAPLASLAS